jgi:hypothetical protein
MLVVTLLSCPAMAQTSNGTIVGKVTDKTGASVPNADVTATDSERGGGRSVQTDASGAYRIESLLPGQYVVSVKASGFADFKVSGVEVKGSLTTNVDATLEVAGQAATVLVEASAGQELQTQSGDLASNFQKEEIQQIPLLTNNPISLALTQAGVSGSPANADFTNGVGFSVNGTRPRANNFLIDGQDDNDNAINGQAYQPTNLEAVGEVTVLQNSYSAEYGRGGGSVTNVISKGGTNTWHGSAFEWLRSNELAAAPHENLVAGCEQSKTGFHSNDCNPVDIENIFGFTIGGPIVKNKLFVFGSPQWDRERQTQNGTTQILPTANGVATLKAVQPTLSAGGQANVQYLLDSLGGLVGTAASGPGGTFSTLALGNDPVTGNPRPAVEIGKVQRSGVGTKSNDRQEWIRVDFNASDKDVLTARYIRDDFALSPDFFNFAGSLPPFDSQQGGPSQTFGASWTHTVNAHVINEFRASYTNIGFTFGPTPATASNPLSAMPSVTLNGSGLFTSSHTFGFPSNLPQGRAHKTYQYQELLSYAFGKHTFRGGVDVNHLTVTDAIPFNSRGTFAINAGGGYNALGNFIDNFTGASGSVAKVFGNPVLKPFVTTYAPYVEDTWHMTPNFTAVFGLRYEYWGTVENSLQFPAIDKNIGIGVPGATFPGSFAAPQISDRNNFGPRIGLAYTPHRWRRLFGEGDTTVLRAGFGIFYDGLFTNILDNTGAAQPNAVGGTLVGGAGRGLANASGLLAAVQPTLNPRGGITTIAGGLINPRTEQWNFNIERKLPGSFLLTTAYVGTRGEHLYVNQEYNPRVNFGARLNPAFGPITVRTNGADSIYHSLQLTMDRRFTKGLLLRGAYTFSKLIDDGSEVFTTTGTSSFPQNPFDQGGDRGLSAFDHRHRFVLTYVWDLPYVHRYAILKAITKDWQTAGTATFSKGNPQTITAGFDINGDGRGTNDRPDLGNPKAPFTAIAVDGANPNFGITNTPGTFFELNNANVCDNKTIACVPVDPTQFHWLIQAAGLGNVGRNTIETPGLQLWNMQVQRTFKFTERHALTLRGEFFNAFNHGNRGVSANGLNPSYTLIDPNFDNIVGSTYGFRQIRIYLKYFF